KARGEVGSSDTLEVGAGDGGKAAWKRGVEGCAQAHRLVPTEEKSPVAGAFMAEGVASDGIVAGAVQFGIGRRISQESVELGLEELERLRGRRGKSGGRAGQRAVRIPLKI